MNIQTPIEVRKALGIRIRTKLAEIPADMHMPIPKAEWADDPKLFNRKQFIEETSMFMEKVYGYEPASYQLLVMFLAEEMQTFMDATLGFIESGSEIVVNGKQSPWLKVRDIASANIIRLNRELGLTPASRLPATTIEKPAKDVYEVLPFPMG
jgi:phage terminase small subunit